MNMSWLLGNSMVPNYLKLAAVLMVLSTYFAALGIAVDEYLTVGPAVQFPPLVAFVLGTGLASALQVLQIHVTSSIASKGAINASSPSA